MLGIRMVVALRYVVLHITLKQDSKEGWMEALKKGARKTLNEKRSMRWILLQHSNSHLDLVPTM